MNPISSIGERIASDDSLTVESICGMVRDDDEKCAAVEAILSASIGKPPLVRARMMRALAKITGDDAYQQKVYDAITEAVAFEFELPKAPTRAAILHDQVVWAKSPVRIDLAGGWSDTPPICNERGGAVVNLAVKLNGEYPIQAIAKLNTRGCIHLSSIDLGESIDFTSAEQILDYTDPRQWSALAKAALVVAGVAPSKPGESLSKWLDVLGGGIDLTIFSSVPKGSGLGTSSILGATILACLDRVLGREFDVGNLIHRSSMLEQLLRTGGGWQDQIGGIVPGLKFMETKPGSDQTVSIEKLDFKYAEEFTSRCLLYYSGQKRMARNILQNVVNSYLDRNPDVIETIESLKDGACASRDAFKAGDSAVFIGKTREYWALKRRIDAGSTNESIEKLLAFADDGESAAILTGAGGGGFAFIVARDRATAARIKAKMLAHPVNDLARFFDFEIDKRGLNVTLM